MEFAEDGEAKAIAASWGVDVSLFDDIEWEVDTIDGNDGQVYGFIVRFNDETDREILTELGVSPGETTRRLSLNAFDGPDYSDEDYDRDLRMREGIEDETLSFASEDDGKRFYYVEGQRIFPSEFRALNRTLKIETMVQWFHENYEDPAVRTPYESAEGGYQWIWGGPHDAREEIADEFSDIADDDEIEGAVKEVEKDGTVDWAPIEGSDDYDQQDETHDEPPPVGFKTTGQTQSGSFVTSNGDPIVDGNGNRLVFSPLTSDERNAAFQQELLSRLEQVESAIENYSAHLPPRNHNHPPELVEPDPIKPVDVQHIVEAVIELRSEIQQPTPDPAKLEEKASLFRRVAGAIAAWCGRKLDAAVDSAIQWGVPIGLGWGATNPEAVKEALSAAAATASAWAAYLSSGTPI